MLYLHSHAYSGTIGSPRLSFGNSEMGTADAETDERTTGDDRNFSATILAKCSSLVHLLPRRPDGTTGVGAN